MNNILTIAIPTRNRTSLLESTINGILEQAFLEYCEIVVCDNSTNWETEVLCRKYMENPRFRYFKNAKELSLDSNMMKVASFVQTPYFLWLGDDDYLAKDALERIVSLLNAEAPDFLLLSASRVSEDMQTYFGCNLETSLRNFYTSRDHIYTDPEEFFLKHCFHMPFGTLVVKKELMDIALEGARRFMGTSHAYSGIVFDYLALRYESSKSVKIYLMRKELILLRRVKKTWNDTATKIMLNEIPEWILLNSENFPSASKTVLDGYLNNQFKLYNLVKKRVRGVIKFVKYREYTMYCTNLQKLKFLFVCFLPNLSILRKWKS